MINNLVHRVFACMIPLHLHIIVIDHSIEMDILLVKAGQFPNV